MGYSNRLWVCPFYTRDYKDHMSCEGGRVELPTIGATQNYMAHYCASNEWESCTLARALTEHYEGQKEQALAYPAGICRAYDEKERSDHAQDQQKQGRKARKGGSPPRR